MPAKSPSSTPQEKLVVSEITQNSENFKAIEAVSTKTVSVSQFEDFIESSEFLGDNSLFVRYSFISDENEAFDTSTTEVSPEVAENFNTPPDINISKGRDYNLEFEKNFIALANENLTKREFTEFLAELPNQIKALFLYQLKFVKKLKGNPTGDLIKNLKTQAAINVNHFKLVQVEMFDGYEISKEGEIMINKPKFKLLKKDDIDSLTTTTLCRLKRYYNNNLKIKRDLLSFPIEGQYFFIQPENSITQTVRPSNQERETKNISVQHYVSKDYDAIGSTSNIVVQTGTSIVTTQTTVTPANTTQTATTTTTTVSPPQTTGGY
jgi:hypothetical protein